MLYCDQYLISVVFVVCDWMLSGVRPVGMSWFYPNCTHPLFTSSNVFLQFVLHTYFHNFTHTLSKPISLEEKEGLYYGRRIRESWNSIFGKSVTSHFQEPIVPHSTRLRCAALCCLLRCSANMSYLNSSKSSMFETRTYVRCSSSTSHATWSTLMKRRLVMWLCHRWGREYYSRSSTI